MVSAIPGRRAVLHYEAAALVPWNFSVALSQRKAAAALAVGYTMVVKTPPGTPLTAVSLAYLAIKAGFPPDALSVLTTSLDNTPAVAKERCLHPLMKKVSFKGSTRLGILIQPLCARNRKKTTLELGGCTASIPRPYYAHGRRVPISPTSTKLQLHPSSPSSNQSAVR